MREKLEKLLSDLLLEYCREKQMDPLWRTPLVGFADARAEGFGDLRRIVDPEHALPRELLPEATIVLSYFLPWREEIAASNVGGEDCSAAWANAYVVTNRMVAEWLNPQLAAALRERGNKVAIPQDAGIISEEKLWSHWSQRHVAYLAGLGTFGLNNLLISERGSSGRYFSVV
ncbi:MAG: epoxyqueuosine reductase, partial [Ruthenibacterium sp.]